MAGVEATVVVAPAAGMAGVSGTSKAATTSAAAARLPRRPKEMRAAAMGIGILQSEDGSTALAAEGNQSCDDGHDPGPGAADRQCPTITRPPQGSNVTRPDHAGQLTIT